MDLPNRPLSDGVVTLAPSSPAEAAEVASAVPAGEPGTWEPAPGPYTPDQARHILEKWAYGRRCGARISLTVRAVRDGRFLGAVVLMAGTPDRPQDPVARQALEVAYWIAPRERRAGVASRALRLVGDWARRTPGVDLLWAEIDPANEVSRRVALAGGFAEGELIERETGTVVVFRLTTAP